MVVVDRPAIFHGFPVLAGPTPQEVTRAYLRPALTVRADGITERVPPLWSTSLDKARAQIARANHSVACLHTFDRSGGVVVQGTGFVVGPGLVMTNRHVVTELADADSTGKWQLKAGGTPAGVYADFAKEQPPVNPSRFAVTEVAYVHPRPGPDVALLRVAGPLGRDAMKFSAAPIASSDNALVYVVGHPSSQAWLNDRELATFGPVRDIKRVSPGLLTGSSDRAYYHDCSTTGGNSGSPLVDLETGMVCGVHFCGEYEAFYANRDRCLEGDNTLDRNFAVPAHLVLSIPEVRTLLGLD